MKRAEELKIILSINRMIQDKKMNQLIQIKNFVNRLPKEGE